MATKKRPSAIKRSLEAQRARMRDDLQEKLRALRSLRDEGVATWDRQWQIVGDILDGEPPLWRAAYESESAFIRKELPGETMRSVRRSVIVARAFAPSDIEARGVTVLEEIALYVQERSGSSAPPEGIDLDRTIVMVPHGRGGIERLSGRVVEVRQVRAARRALRKGSAGARRASPVERAIRAALAAREELRGVSVRIEGEHVAIASVPLAALSALAKALRTIRLPS